MGSSVNLHLLYISPFQSCTPSIISKEQKKVITNDTFPKWGRAADMIRGEKMMNSESNKMERDEINKTSSICLRF